MSAPDRYAEWDAAYVLGALSPDERGEFEQHLAGCDRCRAAVGELAGMPGLLAQVPPAEAWAMLDEPSGAAAPARPEPAVPVSASSEPTAPVVPLRARARRLPWWQLAAAAVLVAVLGGLGGFGLRSVVGQRASQHLGFAAVAPSAMTAVVDLTPVSGGTEVRVECQYAEATDGETYAVWVIDRRGRGSKVKDWTVRPNRVMHPTGTSTLPLRSIASVEIREGDTGQVLLRADRD